MKGSNKLKRTRTSVQTYTLSNRVGLIFFGLWNVYEHIVHIPSIFFAVGKDAATGNPSEEGVKHRDDAMYNATDDGDATGHGAPMDHGDATYQGDTTNHGEVK